MQAVQSIGNLGQQLGQGKELWMAPLHPFLLQSVARVKDFLDQLVDVQVDEGKLPCGPTPQPGPLFSTPLSPHILSSENMDLWIS